jgi:hypothetical protein
MIEALKEWLPDDVGFSDFDYTMDAYDFGQKKYKQFLMDNLK